MSAGAALRWALFALVLLGAGVRATRRGDPATARQGTRRGELLLGAPVGAQRLTICQPAAVTAGRVVVMDVRFPPRGRRLPDHRHPEQEEQVELLSGALRARLHGRERALSPGDVLVVPPGAPHAVWNEGPIEARAVRQLHPALGTEALVAELAQLEAGGRAAAWRLPLVLRAHRRELRVDALGVLRALVGALRDRG